jgi:hypothetical protein
MGIVAGNNKSDCDEVTDIRRSLLANSPIHLQLLNNDRTKRHRVAFYDSLFKLLLERPMNLMKEVRSRALNQSHEFQRFA